MRQTEITTKPHVSNMSRINVTLLKKESFLVLITMAHSFHPFRVNRFVNRFVCVITFITTAINASLTSLSFPFLLKNQNEPAACHVPKKPQNVNFSSENSKLSVILKY